MKIFLAGHRGMVGSAIERRLKARDPGTVQIITAKRDRLDLLDQRAVRSFVEQTRPDAVIVAGAKVGGIHANSTHPADFIFENLMIECNLVHAAYLGGVEKLLFLGSSCIYPGQTAQPIPETALLSGPLEPTNEPYAIAKIAGLKLCESYNRQYGVDYRSVIPTNLYGPGDNFHALNAHVIPALMRRFYEAVRAGLDQVSIWGSGQPRREFLHVDDMAAAALFVHELAPDQYRAQTTPMCTHINVGTGQDIAIATLAALMADITGFGGRVVFDASKPDGTMRKLLDTTKLDGLGWRAAIGLEQGLRDTYRWYRDQATVKGA